MIIFYSLCNSFSSVLKVDFRVTILLHLSNYKSTFHKNTTFIIFSITLSTKQ